MSNNKNEVRERSWNVVFVVTIDKRADSNHVTERLFEAVAGNGKVSPNHPSTASCERPSPSRINGSALEDMLWLLFS